MIITPPHPPTTAREFALQTLQLRKRAAVDPKLSLNSGAKLLRQRRFFPPSPSETCRGDSLPAALDAKMAVAGMEYLLLQRS